MIKRLLVANRGEIARRVFATCRRLGIETVAVYSDADAGLPFVREADAAVRLPGNTPADTYLRADLVLEAAPGRGADAIHPGYGFLSENAEFASSVIAAGLTWVGPAPESIEQMGSKIESKLLMKAAGVRCSPMKTLIIVRNPLEAAYSMRKRNGTSYAFGLRLWEIYNRRLIEAATKQDRLFTHYDLFFEDAEKELQRIANFIGLPDAKIRSAAELVATKRRHTHFAIDQLVDAGVSGEVVDLYRALIAQASSTQKHDVCRENPPPARSHTRPIYFPAR